MLLLHSEETYMFFMYLDGFFASILVFTYTYPIGVQDTYVGYTSDTSRYMYLMRFLDVTLDTSTLALKSQHRVQDESVSAQ